MVCSRWYNVIRDSPPLWSRIYASDSLEVVGMALQRSSSHYLDIVLESFELGSQARDDIRTFFATLRPHNDRWRNVEASARFPWMHVVTDAFKGSAPNLERLSVTDQDTVSSSVEVDLFGGAVPQLKHLTLNGVSVRWSSEVVRGLKVIDLSWICFPSANTILDILSHSLQLQRAVIRRCTTGTVAMDSSPSVQLPNLSFLQLDLGRLEKVDWALDRIEVPKPCSFATSFRAGEDIEDFLSHKVLKWISKWKPPAQLPLDGFLLDIDHAEMIVEMSMPDHPEPLSFAIEASGPGWADQFQLTLRRLISEFVSWTKTCTTFRLKLGYAPPQSKDCSTAQFIIQELTRLPPVTSLEISTIGEDSLLDTLIREGNASVFQSVRTLSFSMMGAIDSTRTLEWISSTVRTINDSAAMSSNELNHRQLQRIEVWVPFDVDLSETGVVKATVKDLEAIVGYGKVFIVDDI
ncbi:hypothetical protein FRC05_000994 [Tulasnella sp. 425]|nr:hypothetical protein FRC05_000994 [Tulasnella sp. 425]